MFCCCFNVEGYNGYKYKRFFYIKLRRVNFFVRKMIVVDFFNLVVEDFNIKFEVIIG